MVALYTLYPCKSLSVFAFHVKVAEDEVGADTVKVTGMVLGEFVAPVDAIEMVALYVPVARPVVLMLIVDVPVPVPEVGLGVNHVASSLTVQLSVPPPVLEIVSPWFIGFDPPCMAVKFKVVGLNPIVPGAVSVRVTVIV